ncbi:MAG: gamma-glutamylcyclotransferase [Aliidongia sp.]
MTRETILSGAVRRVAAQVPGMVVLSDAELAASIADTLAAGPQADASGDVWIFGYGSLIWNPAFGLCRDAARPGSPAGTAASASGPISAAAACSSRA